MSKAKWTPGPWFATDIDYPDDGTLSGPDGGAWTVSTDPDAAGWRHDGGYPGYGVSEANARLMSAAPELFGALEELLKNHVEMINGGDCGGSWDPETDRDVMAARAAIAKARGERLEGGGDE